MTSEMARFSAEEWLKVWGYLNSAMHQQKLIQQQQQQQQQQQTQQTSNTSEESGRDSIQSTPTNTGDEAEVECPQPLNLSLTTTAASNNDPYDHEFLDHKIGKNLKTRPRMQPLCVSMYLLELANTSNSVNRLHMPIIFFQSNSENGTKFFVIFRAAMQVRKVTEKLAKNCQFFQNMYPFPKKLSLISHYD